MSSLCAGARPAIIAHRGESCDAPENTMPAFQLAVTRQVDGIECDIYLSTDQQLFCYHDETLKRLAKVDKKVSDLSYAALQEYDVGSWKGAAFKGTRIPLLRQLLALAADERKIFVEVKCGVECVPHLKALFASMPEVNPTRVFVITFHAPVVTAIKKALPDYTVYYLASVKKSKEGELVPTAETLIQRAKACGADGVDVSGEHITAAYVQAVKAAGLSVHVWTIDTPDRANAVAAMGVDSITTNRGGEMKKILSH